MRTAVAAAVSALLALAAADGAAAPSVSRSPKGSVAATTTPPTNRSLGDPITVDLSLEGVAPAELTDVAVALSCRGLAGPAPSRTHTAHFGTHSGSTVLRVPLTRAGAGNQGSSCIVTIAATGTGDISTGLPLEVLVGGSRRTMTPPVLVSRRHSEFSLGPIPIDRPTDVRVTYVYPAIAVRKAVAGEPPMADYAYPFELRCWDPTGSPVAPVGQGGSPPFDGRFTLRAGQRRMFGTSAYPALTARSVCEARETSSLGASVRYSSTDRGAVGGPEPRAGNVPGVLLGGVARSALTRATAETITVLGRFTGELRVRRAGPAGDPAMTVSVECEPTDSAAAPAPVRLGAGQTRLYRGLLAGAQCTVEPGAQRVTIPLRTTDPTSVAVVTVS